MRVCKATDKAAPERKLRYNDLNSGDVFSWEPKVGSYYMIKDEKGHTIMTGMTKGNRYTESYLSNNDYEVVVYPDACLEPGEATTHTLGGTS